MSLGFSSAIGAMRLGANSSAGRHGIASDTSNLFGCGTDMSACVRMRAALSQPRHPGRYSRRLNRWKFLRQRLRKSHAGYAK